MTHFIEQIFFICIACLEIYNSLSLNLNGIMYCFFKLKTYIISKVTFMVSQYWRIQKILRICFAINHALVHSIYIWTVSSKQLLSTLLIQFELVYGPFGQTWAIWIDMGQKNTHSTLNFFPRPSRKGKQMYHYIRKNRNLLSLIYCALVVHVYIIYAKFAVTKKAGNKQ